jgi:hypothetical protein
MKRPERKDLDWRERLAFALAGLFTVAYGYGQILRGKSIYTNWRGLDVSAQFVIFLGALLLFVALFPWGRVYFVVTRIRLSVDGKRPTSSVSAAP